MGLASFLTARADVTVMDDDFNDPNNNLTVNTSGLGGGYGSFLESYTFFGYPVSGFAYETNSLAVVGNYGNGAGRANIASMGNVDLSTVGTLFDFRNVSYTNATSVSGPNTDRLIIGVLATNVASDWFESGLASMPEGFYIEPNSDSIAYQIGGTGNSGWADHNSVLFYKGAGTSLTVLTNWQFQTLNWSPAPYVTDYSPVLDIQLTLGATGWHLFISGDVNTNGQPIDFSGTYADAGISNIVFLDGIHNCYIGTEGQTEGPCIQENIDRIVVSHLGNLVVTTPKFQTPEYHRSVNVVRAGEEVSLSSFVTDSVAPPTLQWQMADLSNPGAFTNLPSGNGTNVVLDTSGLGDSLPRGIRLLANDGLNSITSAVVTLTVNPASAPVDVQDPTPSALTLYQGQGGTFTAAFTGNLPITYQWQFSPDFNVFTNIPDATNDYYIIQSASLSDAGYYQLVASNSVGVTTTANVGYLDVLTGNPKYIWSAALPYAYLSAEQILTNFPSTNKIAGALVAQNGGNGITVTLTNAGNEQIVFAGMGDSWANVTGGNGWGTGANTNLTGNTPFNNCLNAFYNDNGTHTITMSNLIVGQQYQVQLFALDDRAANLGNSVTWQDPADPNDVSAQYNMGDNAYMLGTFTASNSVEMIQQNLPLGFGNFNCMVLRTVGWNPPPYWVNEPTGAGNYVGARVSLSGRAAGDTTIPSPTITYQWQAGPAGGPYTNLVEGAKYAGTTTRTLTISNLTVGDSIPAYVLVAANGSGSTTSSVANVTVQLAPPAPAPGSYGAYALSNAPVAYWQLDETNNPAVGSVLAYDYTGNGHFGTYGATAQNAFNGVLSPQPPAFPGFAANQGALKPTTGDLNSTVTIPPLNLSGASGGTLANGVTIAMWINPAGNVGTATGLLFNRNGGDAAGFGFGGNTSSGGMAELGYTWNQNNANTYNYHSGLYPVVGVWQFVALVVKSNSATIYQYYTDPTSGQSVRLSAVNAITHTSEAFSGGTTLIGGDSNNANRTFPGAISDAAVYNSALTPAQILQLFGAGLGVSGFSPLVSGVSQDVFYPAPLAAGRTVSITATANGTLPLTNQWMFNGVNLADGAYLGSTVSGSQTATLTISNVTYNNVGSYQMLVTNAFGTTNSPAVHFTVLPATLVGEWLSGAQSLADVSGYSPAGIHDASVQSGTTYWTNDVPPTAPPGSSALVFNNAGLIVANSSTLDAAYTNTFDNQINNGLTVMCWAKGMPSGWAPFVSKYGEGPGWQLRDDGSTGVTNACWTVRGTGGTARLGAAVYGNAEDMATRTIHTGNDGKWHHYVGTYSPVTGLRSLYIDGVLAAQETGNRVYNLASAEHLMIGAKDQPPGNNFTGYFTGEMYDVRIYNYALPEEQVVAIAKGVPQTPGTFVTPGAFAKFTTPGINAAPPFTGYQWQFNGANLTDGAYLGATVSGSSTISLAVTNITAANAGTYQLLVTNVAGVTTSSIVNLTVMPTTMVGQWLSGSQSLADVSGFSPAGVHDAGVQSGAVGWSPDVPTSAPPGSFSLAFTNAGLVISNTSTLDAGYTNTFDNQIANGMTVMFWAKPLPGAWNPWVSKYGESIYGWQLRDFGANPNYPAWTIRGTGGTEDMTSTFASNNGRWNHYAGTYDASTGVRSLYVDGVLAAQQTGQGPYNLTDFSHLMIGARDAGGNQFGNYFTGYLYDVRVYNYALSQSQIEAAVPGLSAAGLTPVFTGRQFTPGTNGAPGQMVLSWPFGTLLEATNVAGPWNTTTNTSPFTNNMTLPADFYKVSNP